MNRGWLHQLDRRAWAAGLLLVAALVTGLALLPPFADAELGRRLLVLHAALGGILLPLALAVQASMLDGDAAAGRSASGSSSNSLPHSQADPATKVAAKAAARAAATARANAFLARCAPFAWLALAAALAWIALGAAGRPVLTTFLPSSSEPAFALLLLGAAAFGFAALARGVLPKPRRRKSLPAAPGLAWSALPLAVALASLAWGWTATAEQAGHVRAELATWAAGHAWLYFLASLLTWALVGLGEGDRARSREPDGGADAARNGEPRTEPDDARDAVRRARWCAAAALPAVAVLIVQAALPVDDARYLRAFPELLRWTLWPVPLLLALTLLRDGHRRRAGGALLAAAAGLCALLAGAALALSGDTARMALLIIEHALPLALFAAAGGLLLRLSSVATPHFQHAASGGPALQAPNSAPTDPAPLSARRAARSGALAAVALVATLAVLIALVATPQRLPLPERLPQGETPRQHVDAKHAEEIAQRFAQGVEMMRRKEFGFATKAFHRVLELDPTLPEAHVNMGFALLETGDPASAQRFFESATRLKRDQLNAYYGLALAAQAQNNLEVAVGAMRTWLHLAPTDDPFRAQAEARFDAMQQAFAAQRRAPADPP